MKIFTLLTQILKMVTGHAGRNLAFKSSKLKAQSVKSGLTPNAQRPKQGLMPKAQRSTPESLHTLPGAILNSNNFVPQVNAPLHNTTSQIKNESVPQISASLKNTTAPIKNDSVSFEYKLMPVQKNRNFFQSDKVNTITPVQTIKPVVMQNFFAIVKKIFSLSDHPKTLLENLNDGYHPGCSYGTAGPENNSRINQPHDVAKSAASFAFIPVNITPTAMSHVEMKTVKTVTGRSGIFGIIMLMSSLCFVTSTSFAQVIVSAQTGPWSNPTTWVGNAVPGPTSSVQIRGGFTVTVDIANASCASLKIGGDPTNGNNSGILAFAATGNPVLTVSGNIQDGGDGNTARTGTITFVSGSTLNAGSITLGSNLPTPATGTITMTAGSILNVAGAIVVNTVTGNTWTPGGGTVNLTASSTLPTTIFTSFSNLQINNSSVITFPSAKSITSNLSVGTGSSLNLGTFTHTAGTLTLGGQGTVNGSWGSTTSAATNKNNTFFAATTGIINVNTSTCTPPSAPTVNTPVNYCLGSTASQLTATGSNLLWYAGSSGGTGSAIAPTPLTAPAGNTQNFWVSQTVGCESPRAQITVNVNPVPSASVNGSTNITCNGAADGTITIAASGGTPSGGGTPSYFFSVDGGSHYTNTAQPTPYIFPGLSPNTPYTIRVKDANGCQSQTF